MSNRYRYIDEDEEHLHTLDGRPLMGTSSIVKVVAKPLTWWASGLAVKEFGCPDPKILTKIKNKKATQEEVEAFYDFAAKMHLAIKGMGLADYIKLIDKAYRAHAVRLKDSAQEGVDLHAELERFVKDEMRGENRMAEAYSPRILPFIRWARNRVKRYLWSEVNCYSERLWAGGISDLGIEDVDGGLAVLDFKSSKDAYPEQFWQCAGYAMEVGENGGLNAAGDVTHPDLIGFRPNYLAVVPFGAEEVYPRLNFEVSSCMEAFEACGVIYKKLPKD